MLSNWFVLVVQVLVVLILVAFLATYLKRLFIVKTITIGKGTWDNETMNQTAEITIFDSEDGIAKKSDAMFVLADDRHKSNLQKYEGIMAKAEEYKAVQEKMEQDQKNKLKSIK